MTGKLRFNVKLLSDRLIAVTDWLMSDEPTADLGLGFFGAGTGAAAALRVAAVRPYAVQAVVSYSGRPDLAADFFRRIHQPTLLIVGEDDREVIGLNRTAMREMLGPARMEILGGAAHLFEEPGTREQVTQLAEHWFLGHLRPHPKPSNHNVDKSAPRWLDRSLVDRFVNDQLDEQGQAALAHEVVRVVPFHAMMPNATVVALERVIRKLGGQQALFAWPEQFNGRPRLAAHLYRLIGLLGRFSAKSAVLDALRRLRTDNRYPPGLADYLTADTSDATLAGLAFRIEALLGDEDIRGATGLALSATDLLSEVARLAVQTGADVADLAESTLRMRADLQAIMSEIFQ